MIPDLSPLIAYDLICRSCGQEMTRTIRTDQQGRAHAIVYNCERCDFWLESDVMLGARQYNGKPPVKE